MAIFYDEIFISADVPIETAEDERVILEAGLRNVVEELEENPYDQKTNEIFLAVFTGYCRHLQAVNGVTPEQAQSASLKLATEFRQAYAERRDNANLSYPSVDKDSSR
jgi:hypothetical protein